MTFATFFFRFFIDRFPQYVVPINSNATLNHSTAHSSLLCHFSLLLLSSSLLPSVTSAWRSTLVAFNFWLKWQTLACVCSTTFSQRFYRKIHICERPSALSLSMYPMWKVRLSFFMANWLFEHHFQLLPKILLFIYRSYEINLDTRQEEKL